MKLHTNFIENAENCYSKIIDSLIENELYSDTNAIIMMMTKNYIDRVKTISVLSNLERVESITVLTRTLIELYVSILHIIDSENSDKLASSYYYNYKVQTMKTLLKTNNNKVIELSDKELASLKKEVPHANSYNEAYRYYKKNWLNLFDSKFKCSNENQRKWYSLDGKITTFLKLMQSVGIPRNICDFYYGLLSIDTHATGAIGTIKENTMTFEFLDPEICYFMIDINLSNIVCKLGERYNLLEDEVYQGFLREMADSSIINT